MQFIAVQKDTRQSPRKVRLVANSVKNLPLDQALQQLAVIERKASLVVFKTVRQAIANAEHNHGTPLSELVIKEITVGEGQRFRRFRAVSRGRAHGIVKRSCHVRVVLEKKAAAQSKVEPVAKKVVTETKPKATSKTAVAKSVTKKTVAKKPAVKKVTKTSKK